MLLDSQLCIECKDGRVERVKLLLQLGASPNVPDSEYHISTLAAACMTHCSKPNNKQLAIVTLLLQHGADSSIQDKRGMNIVHHLAQFSQDDKMLKLLLQSGKVDPNVPNNKGDTALHLLCKYERSNGSCLRKARHLVEFGADPSLLNSDRESPLCIASYKARPKLLFVLLSKSTDPNGNRLAQCTPIDNVAKGYAHHSEKESHFSNYYNCIDILQKKGAEINIKRLSGFQALFYTIRFHTYSMTKYLIMKGMDPNYQDINGDTALHKAYSSCTHILSDLGDADKILFDGGANPNIKNRNGYVPACRIPFHDSLSMLSSNRKLWFEKIQWNLQAGLDVKNMSDSLHTKLQFSTIKHCRYDLINILHESGFHYKLTDIESVGFLDAKCVEYVKYIERNPVSLQQASAKAVRLSFKPNAIKGTKLLSPPPCIAKAITLGYITK